MQGERASLGSLSETLNFEHGSTSSNGVIDTPIRWENLADNDTNASFANSVYNERRNLHRFSLGESSSSSGSKNVAASSHGEQWMERRHDKLELSPLFAQQPPSGNRVVRNVNLNAEYNEHLEDMNSIFTGHPGLCEVNRFGAGLLPERDGSSVEGHRMSCKRKALDSSSIGQSSSSGGGFREFHRGESSSWAPGPAFYSPDNNLNISLDHGPRVHGSGITEGSNRNLFVGEQQETVNPAVFAAGSVVRRPVAPSMNLTRLLPLNHELRYGNGSGNFTSHNPNASSATQIPAFSRNMIPPFQWSGNPVAAGGSSSSSAAPVYRNVIRQSSNVLENPLFVPAPELRSTAHSHISRNATAAGHVASSSSNANPSSSSSQAWSPYQNHLPNNQRRLSEHFRRSLLSSLATNQRATTRSLIPAASPDEHAHQPARDNTVPMQNRTFSRAGPREGQSAASTPHSVRGLTSTSRGRSRLAVSEIRNVLERMRRTGSLCFEDAMLLNQSVLLGGADIIDRYRDMRLDVDNMTYEELLSLEEQIGDVCTGLSEETVSNGLKKQRYTSSSRSSQEVEPCCICQEEYNQGEEMGILECGHDFHSQCIKEWLMRKNLCPICKTTGLNTAEKPRRL